MSDVTPELHEPVARAKRATKAAARTTKTAAAKVGADAKATATTVAGEAKSFGRRSTRTVKAAGAKIGADAKIVKSAAEDGADAAAELAQDRLRASLEAIQKTSEEMSRWAGARAVEAKDQASALVQERPLGVVAGIFAVGALLGVVAGIVLRD